MDHESRPTFKRSRESQTLERAEPLGFNNHDIKTGLKVQDNDAVSKFLEKQKTHEVSVQDSTFTVYFLIKNKNTVKSRLIPDKKNVRSTTQNVQFARETKGEVLPESAFN